jgi:hypothetical protein
MPPFTKPTVAAFKRTLLPRVDVGCKFTNEDVAALQEETHMTRDQILKWAEHVRDRYRGLEVQRQYLSNDDDALQV